MVDNVNSIKFGAGPAPAAPSSPEGYTMNPDPFIKLETPPDATQFTTNTPAPEEKKKGGVLVKVLLGTVALLALSLGSSALAKKLATSGKTWLAEGGWANKALGGFGKIWDKTAEYSGKAFDKVKGWIIREKPGDPPPIDAGDVS